MGLHLSVSQKMASMKGNKGLSSIVGNLALPTTSSICAYAFSCTAGFNTIVRKNIINTEWDCFILLVMVITIKTLCHGQFLLQLTRRITHMSKISHKECE